MGWKQIDGQRLIWEGTIELDDEDAMGSSSIDAVLATKKYVDSNSGAGVNFGSGSDGDVTI